MSLGTTPFIVGDAPPVGELNVPVYTVRSTSVTGAILTTDDLVLGTTGASDITLTLPAAGSVPGENFIIKKVDSGAGKIVVAGTIDGLTDYDLVNQWQFVSIVSNATDYDIIATN